MTEIINWIGNISSVLSLVGIVYALGKWRWQNRKIAIFAICGSDEKLLAHLPARLVTRGEVSGIVSQCAKGPERLDLSKFNFEFYKIQNVIKIPLNEHDFSRIPK